MRALFRLGGSRARSFEARDRDLALYGPLSLFALAATWLVLTGTGYMLLFWSLGARPPREALALRGSSIYALGFAVPPICRPRCWPSPRPVRPGAAGHGDQLPAHDVPVVPTP